MTTKILSIAKQPTAQAGLPAPDGPISYGLHQRLLALSEKIRLLPDAEIPEARKILHNLFDDAQRVAGLEDAPIHKGGDCHAS